MISMIVLSISIISLFLIIDFLQKKVIKKVAWSRKATHIFAGAIIMLFPSYLTVLQILIMSIGFTIILFISKHKNILSLHEIKRKSCGEILYPLSVGILALITLPNNTTAFYVGLLCLALSDAAASIVGMSFPIKILKIGKHEKSVGGFLAFLAVTLAIFTIAYMPQGANFATIIIVSTILSICELLSFYGTDNLTIPIAASLFAIYII